MAKTKTRLRPPKVPCGTCPYRRDVPAGLWSKDEYDKLPLWDAETASQPTALFMCHQGTGCLCGGWLLMHGSTRLRAVQYHAHELHPAVWDYAPNVAVFSSGTEAAAHGIAGLKDGKPTPKGEKFMEGRK